MHKTLWNWEIIIFLQMYKNLMKFGNYNFLLEFIKILRNWEIINFI